MHLTIPDKITLKIGDKEYKEVEVKDFMPRSILLKFTKAQQKGEIMNSNDIILKGCMNTPKISQQFLDSDDYDPAILAILAVRMLEEYNMTEDRIDLLKKKVHRQ